MLCTARPCILHRRVSTPAYRAASPAQVDLNRPMAEVLAQLSRYPVRTRLSLSGSLVVARDIAHAKLQVCVGWGWGRRAAAALVACSIGIRPPPGCTWPDDTAPSHTLFQRLA